jgi:hypothetical protein
MIGLFVAAILSLRTLSVSKESACSESLAEMFANSDFPALLFSSVSASSARGSRVARCGEASSCNSALPVPLLGPTLSDALRGLNS